MHGDRRDSGRALASRPYLVPETGTKHIREASIKRAASLLSNPASNMTGGETDSDRRDLPRVDGPPDEADGCPVDGAVSRRRAA
jgi:hypothetical protein